MELIVVYWPYRIKSQQILLEKREWEVKKPYGICRVSLQCELSSQSPHDRLMSRVSTRMMLVGWGVCHSLGPM